jgi:hypothetical protein
MNQNQTENPLTPNSLEEGVLKPTGAETDTEFEAPKEAAETQQIAREAMPTINEAKAPVLPVPKKRAHVPLPPPRDELTKKVEKIMSDGLEESFAKLPPVVQQEFKLKGEQTAGKIRELLKATKIHVKKIFRLILEWLSLLPNVNKFFLEQEAKIKTDKIIVLKKREEEKIHL